MISIIWTIKRKNLAAEHHKVMVTGYETTVGDIHVCLESFVKQCVREMNKSVTPKPDLDQTALWFKVQGTVLRFSRVEFALISGLRYGSAKINAYMLSEKVSVDSVYARLLESKPIFTAYLRTKFMDKHFKVNKVEVKGSENDYLKLAKVLMASMFVVGLDPNKTKIPTWMWVLVEDNDAWDRFPWGSMSYQFLIGQINAVKKNVPGLYHLKGNTIAFLAWLYEVIHSVGLKIGGRMEQQRRPRMLRYRYIMASDFPEFPSKVIKLPSPPRPLDKTPSQRLLQVIALQRYENHGLRFSSSDKTGSKAFLTNAKWKELVGDIVRPDLEVTSSTPESTQYLSSGYEVLLRLRRAVYDALIRCARPARLWDLYAFAVGPSKFSNTNPRVRLLNEYFRLLGLGSHHASSITIEDGSFTLCNEWWRISSVNSNYTICPTYPFALLIPNSISDVDIQQACTFRARCRLPVISWCHPGTGAVLARSSQPLVGLMMNMRSNADEKLVAALWTQLAGSKERRRKLYIADARPRKNALANGAMGGGSESSANYSPSEIVFFGIDNIHAMRESLVRLRDYVDTHGANSSDGMSSFLVRLGFFSNKDLFARKELDRVCLSLVKSDVSFRSVCSRSKSRKESEVGSVWK
ncbi:hypothetical protein OROGR_025604 [Orobanche gracilis]